MNKSIGNNDHLIRSINDTSWMKFKVLSAKMNLKHAQLFNYLLEFFLNESKNYENLSEEQYLNQVWKIINSKRIDCNLNEENTSEELEGVLFKIEELIDQYNKKAV